MTSTNSKSVTFEMMQDYLFCSLYFYWKHIHANMLDEISPNDYSTANLPGEAISQALQVWSTGKYVEHPFKALVGAVWKKWFDDHDVKTDAQTMIAGYAELRERILMQFIEGKITARGGKKYTEPRMTNRYKAMMDTGGVTHLETEANDAVLKKMAVTKSTLEGLGVYSLAEAYSDSIVMASRYSPPAINAIIGVAIPATIQLGDTIKVKTIADLIVSDGDGGAIVEVHDCHPMFYYQRQNVGKRIDVIAASLLTGETPPIPPIKKVIYRHFMSATTMSRKQLRHSRLQFAMVGAVRGIRSKLYLPQFLSGDHTRCRMCAAANICLGTDGHHDDILEHYLPGTIPNEA